MPFTYKYICGDITKDGRHLGMVEYDGPLTESEVVQLLSEALAPYAFHVKTSDSALAFAKYITGFGDDKVYFDANGYLIIDYPVPN